MTSNAIYYYKSVKIWVKVPNIGQIHKLIKLIVYYFLRLLSSDVIGSCEFLLSPLYTFTFVIAVLFCILKRLPWELWLRRSDARVRRVLLRLREPSGASACSRSAEKSESSVPSELLPVVLYKQQRQTVSSSLRHLTGVRPVCVCVLPVDNST